MSRAAPESRHRRRVLATDDESLYIKVGFFELRGPFGILGSVVLGIIVGLAVALYSVIAQHQPDLLVEPMIDKEVQKRIASLPTRTPAPTVGFKILNPDTRLPLPAQGETYNLRPKQMVWITAEPESADYNWSVIPSSYGQLIPVTNNQSQMQFIAPDLGTGQAEYAGSVQACNRERSICFPALSFTTTPSAR